MSDVFFLQSIYIVIFLEISRKSEKQQMSQISKSDLSFKMRRPYLTWTMKTNVDKIEHRSMLWSIEASHRDGR